ncbi:GNAT family N-acetyltransferase [Mucilaginibacter aquariorum]|uniref:GNAT family N-acetyltransferase n=1 Tax=Mucilaginibacter aquariorum TaxID=2967225 RepID=A0ABT1SZX3_9SPHI|nr:GNAT family N-acetyltransferase [Mucilaginibacter aquariorum]MCQ6957894.1 GNAT family N-acetyltransferase [Mucilaginibacter aquariorum]
MLKLKLHPSPQLFSPRLKLRAVTNNDAAEIYAMRSNEEVMKYIDRPLPASVTEVDEWINKVDLLQQKNESILWAITLQDSDTLIGTIGYWRMLPEHYRAEIGYMLNPAYQGKGLMSEALNMVIQYGFNNIGLHSIEANANPANQASIKLLEKTGFVREGYFKENYYFNGNFLDSAIYSLICSKK